MNAKQRILRTFLNSVKGGMRLAPSVWLLTSAVFMASTYASNVWGDGGPLTIEKIECEGNETTSCSHIQELSSFKEGDTLDEEQIQQSKLRLQLVGLFEHVEVRLARGSSVGKANVVFNVVERSPYTISFNGGLNLLNSHLDRVADFTVANRNLTGDGDVLSIRFRHTRLHDDLGYMFIWPRGSKETEDTEIEDLFLGRAEYTRSGLVFPRLFATTGLTVSSWNRHYLFGSPEARSWFGWDGKSFAVTGDLALGYMLTDFSSISLGYQPAPFTQSSGWANVRTVFLKYNYDSQDDAIFPTQGSRFQFSFTRMFRPDWPSDDYGLDFSYVKHFRLAEGHVLTGRLGRTIENDEAFRDYQDPILSLRYTNFLKHHAASDTIQNATLYLEPGLYARQGGFGVRTGTTLQTSLANVNLSFSYLVED